MGKNEMEPCTTTAMTNGIGRMWQKLKPKFMWKYESEKKKNTRAKSNLCENKVKVRISAPSKMYKMCLMRRSVGLSRSNYTSHSCLTQCCSEFGYPRCLPNFCVCEATLLLVFVSPILRWQIKKNCYLLYLNDGRVSIHSVVSNRHKKWPVNVMYARVRWVRQS